MVTVRTRELLIGAGLAHVIASLGRAVAGRDISAQKQERMALQIVETETQLEFERGAEQHTVH